MAVFELFKEGVIKVRKAVENFKGDHKMASEAISLAIDTMPNPFSKFCRMIWNGLEKEGADPTTKLLEILERLENNNEDSFSEIKTNVTKIIELGAKEEDVQKLGEQIRISSETVTKNVKEAFNEELRKATETIKVTFEDALSELRLDKSNLILETSTTLSALGEGDKDCWRYGHFRDENIKSGHDAKRPITDEIINSISNNKGTILFGKPYYGKSIILKRIMFDLANEGYAVVFAEGGFGMQADLKVKLLVRLLDKILDKFQKVLVIADNVHHTGSEILFAAFNSYFVRKMPDNVIIKFLFGAREDELKTGKELLEREKAAEIDIALGKTHQIRLGFGLEDAVLFLKKATEVSMGKEIPEQSAMTLSDKGYELSRGDPFMFVYFLMWNLAGEWKEETPREFLHRDLDSKIKSLAEDNELLRAALLCSFMGMFGIPLVPAVLESNQIYRKHLKSLAEKGFLFQNGEYKTRHEMWMLAFLVYYFKRDFENELAYFDAKYHIKDMISSILKNIDFNYLVDIIVRCDFLYRQEQLKPIAKVVVDQYFVPEDLEPSKKAELYISGLGAFYRVREEYDRSLGFYDKAIELDPTNLMAWVGKGMVFAKLGKTREAEAIEYFDKVLVEDPKYLMAFVGKGMVLANSGKTEDIVEAIEYFDKVLAIDPNHVGALNNKGNSLEKLAKHQEAIECFDKALAIAPYDDYAWHAKGISVYRLKKYDEAIECFDKALAMYPGNRDVLRRKAITLDSAGKTPEAIKYLDKILAKDPNDIEVLVYRGKSIGKLNKYQEAMQCFDKAIELDPTYIEAWYNKGLVRLNLGKPNEALECLDKVLEIDPVHSSASDKKGVALLMLGKKIEAIECFDKAIELDPVQANAWNNKGAALNDAGKHNSQAIVLYDKALEIDPDLARAWYNKGAALNNLGRPNEALECLNKAIELKPTNVDVLNNKAAILNNLGKHNEALEDLAKALETNPRFVDAWITKGVVLQNLGKNNEAIGCYDKATEIDSKSVYAWYNKARSKVKNGLIEDGLRDLKISIGIDKDVIKVAKMEKDFQNKIPDEWYKEIGA